MFWWTHSEDVGVLWCKPKPTQLTKVMLILWPHQRAELRLDLKLKVDSCKAPTSIWPCQGRGDSGRGPVKQIPFHQLGLCLPLHSINEKARGVTDGTHLNLPIRVLRSPSAPLRSRTSSALKSPVDLSQLLPVSPHNVLSGTPLGESCGLL